MTLLSDRYYMPCWKWESLDDNLAIKYCDRHSRLKNPGQISIWQQAKITNTIKQHEHKKHHNTDNRPTRNCA